MTLARAGLTAEEITDRGGVQASIGSLRAPSAPTEKPESDSDKTTGSHELLSGSERAKRRREARKAAGLCIDCERPSPDHVRCVGCRARISLPDTRRRNLAKLGAHIEPRLANAAARGAGIRLTAEEVAQLLSPTPDVATRSQQ